MGLNRREALTLTNLQGNVRQPQNLGHRFHDRGVDRVGRQRLFQPLPQLGQRFEWFIPLAIQKAVDPTLQTGMDWLEEDSHQPGRQQRQQPVALRLEQDARPAHHQPVDQQDNASHDAIDQGAIDDDVDVVQPVARHGHGHRYGDAQSHQTCQYDTQFHAYIVGQAPGEPQRRHEDTDDQNDDSGIDQPLHLGALEATRSPEAHDDGQHGTERAGHEAHTADIDHPVQKSLRARDAKRVGVGSPIGHRAGMDCQAQHQEG